MITAIVLYDLPETIGLEECRQHFARIAPDFLGVPGFIRKHFICQSDGKTAGGAYLWETQQAAEAFYNGPWLDGIRARYGGDPRITYFETVAIADAQTGIASAV
jgi:Putative mono-oxygenase ydhR